MITNTTSFTSAENRAITVSSTLKPEEMAYAVQICANANSMILHIQSLFTDSTTADCTITCHDKDWQLHTSILSAIPFFNTAFNKGFKESTTKLIDMPDDDPDALHSMLKFIYCHPYTSPDVDPMTGTLHHVTVYNLAQKYSLHLLQHEALVRARMSLDYRLDLLQADSEDFQAIDLAFLIASTRDEPLQTEFIKIFENHKVDLMRRYRDEFGPVILRHPEIAIKMLSCQVEKGPLTEDDEDTDSLTDDF